jgi:putative nucleotidyltransferase with HDIG domain
MLKLFNAPRFVGQVVSWMEQDGVLYVAIPEVAGMRGIGKGGYHHLDVLGHTLEALRWAERLIAAPQGIFASAAEIVEAYLAHPEAGGVVRAAAFFHDIGKPVSYQRDPDKGTTFYGHDDVGAEITGEILQRWGWPRRLKNAVVRLIDVHMRPLQLARSAAEEGQPVTKRALRHLAKDAGDELPALFLLAAADVMAARGRAGKAAQRRRILQTLDEMLGQTQRLTEKELERRFVTGHDLMRELGLSPGPQLGKMLDAIQEAQHEGRIATRGEALALARQLMKSGAESSAREDNMSDATNADRE